MNRITMVTLGVADLAASKTFYEALGWVAEDGPPGVVFFDCDGYKFGLFGLDDLASEQCRPAAELGHGAAVVAVNWPTKEAVDTAFRTATRAGAAPVSLPAQMDWGGYSAYWADPDGHVWEYAMNPFWPLDAQGRLASS